MTAGRLRARAGALALGLVRRHRSGMFALALVVGVLSGLGAVLFRLGIDAWGRLLTGSSEYSGVLGASTGLLSPLGRWFVLVSPVLSGLVIGLLMTRLGRTPTGHGVSGVIWSSRRSDGAMAPVPATASVVSAALTIGGGGSVGPEGPIAELGASAATVFGRRLGLPRRAVRMLAAAGTAAGIAAAFNAPLAGAFFAMEVILVDFTVDAFSFVVLACLSSTVLSHHLLGTTLSISLPELMLDGDAQLAWVALLGLLGGIVGVTFSRSRYLMADGAAALLDRLRVPAWARPAVGGLAVGLALLAVPEMYGESSPVLVASLSGRVALGALLVLVVAKILATSLTLAVGFPGGVFAPSLFIGGTLGAAFGALVAPGRPEVAGVFGVIGMGAVFTGSARAPMTAVILIIEMTGQYHLLMPLMLAVVLATVMSRFLTRTTIYTEELRRRGDDFDNPLEQTVVGRAGVRAVMTEPPGVLTPEMPLRTAAAVLRESGSSVLPVVLPSGRDGAPSSAPDGTPCLGVLLGCLGAVDVAEARAGAASGATVADLALGAERVDAAATATDALAALVSAHAEGLPVVIRIDGTTDDASDHYLLVGWLGQEDMVRRLYRHQRRAQEAAAARTSFGARVQMRWRTRRDARRRGGPTG